MRPSTSRFICDDAKMLRACWAVASTRAPTTGPTQVDVPPRSGMAKAAREMFMLKAEPGSMCDA